MSDRKRIVFVVGSLREGSFNRALARAAAEEVGDRAEVTFLDYVDVPLMNQDLEFPAPDAVTRVREQVAAADGAWVFTPEYNFSFPAPLKNVLDWLSRPLVPGDYDTPRPLTGKPVAVSGAGGKNATAGVRRAIKPLLSYLGAKPVGGEGEGFVLPASAWSEGVYEPSAEDRARLAHQADELLATL